MTLLSIFCLDRNSNCRFNFDKPRLFNENEGSLNSYLFSRKFHIWYRTNTVLNNFVINTIIDFSSYCFSYNTDDPLLWIESTLEMRNTKQTFFSKRLPDCQHVLISLLYWFISCCVFRTWLSLLLTTLDLYQHSITISSIVSAVVTWSEHRTHIYITCLWLIRSVKSDALQTKEAQQKEQWKHPSTNQITDIY